MPYIDLHCDTLSAILKQNPAASGASLLRNDLRIDLCKLRAADCILQTFAIFTDAVAPDPLPRALAQAEINIATLSLADTSDFGIVRMIVDDHARGCEVLSAAGFAVRETDVVTATVPNRPGGMAELMAKLDAAGADIEYSYAYALGDGDGAILVFRFKDNALGEAALADVSAV